jgi:hypothetical protein
MSDIFNDLTADNMENKTIIFSVGHRCTTASLIQIMKQKFESYPFDWIVSKLDVIAHAIDTNFEEYLRSENYETINSETFNICDDTKQHICNENIVYNKYYESNKGDNESSNKLGTYGMKLALTHHDMHKEKDHAYFQRCVTRFNKILSSSRQKFYLHVAPIMGINDYEKDVGLMVHNFTAFTTYMQTKTQNSFGIYFIVVKNEEKKCQIDTLFESNNSIIMTFYVNNNLIDGGGVYDGDFYSEQYKMLVTIEGIIQKQQEHFEFVSKSQNISSSV